jgi:hypothetical protein
VPERSDSDAHRTRKFIRALPEELQEESSETAVKNGGELAPIVFETPTISGILSLRTVRVLPLEPFDFGLRFAPASAHGRPF